MNEQPAVNIAVGAPKDVLWLDDAEVARRLKVADSTQALLETYRGEAGRSHAGEQFKEFVRTLLVRFEEAGAFKP